MENKYKSATERLLDCQKILVVSHVNPEGDAIGSSLGLALALRAAGKDVTSHLADGIPKLFQFLPGADKIVTELDPDEPFDATFAVDCGQKNRLGDPVMALKDPGTLINIDHHATNDRFGDINVVEADKSSAGEMVYDFLKASSIEITKDAAINLYVAIHTDTGSFHYSSSRPSSFIAAGELVALGADPWEVATRVYENHPVEKFKLLGRVLNTLEVFEEGPYKVATVNVSLEMFEETGASSDLSDGFVNYARSVEGVEVGILFRETGDGTYKLSMRGLGGVDVAALAQKFGGGGHRNAAGAAIDGTLDEVKTIVLSALRDMAKTE